MAGATARRLCTGRRRCVDLHRSGASRRCGRRRQPAATDRAPLRRSRLVRHRRRAVARGRPDSRSRDPGRRRRQRWPGARLHPTDHRDLPRHRARGGRGTPARIGLTDAARRRLAAGAAPDGRRRLGLVGRRRGRGRPGRASTGRGARRRPYADGPDTVSTPRGAAPHLRHQRRVRPVPPGRLAAVDARAVRLGLLLADPGLAGGGRPPIGSRRPGCRARTRRTPTHRPGHRHRWRGLAVVGPDGRRTGAGDRRPGGARGPGTPAAGGAERGRDAGIRPGAHRRRRALVLAARASAGAPGVRAGDGAGEGLRVRFRARGGGATGGSTRSGSLRTGSSGDGGRRGPRTRTRRR